MSVPGSDAALAAALLAVDPELGGIVLRARYGPAQAALVARLRELLPDDAPLLRLPPGIADDRLIGGLDLTATLAAGRPVVERGVLAAAHAGCLVVPMAERVSRGLAAQLAMALDSGVVNVLRDGIDQTHDARFCVVALDEGIEADERPPAALLERLALLIGDESDAGDAAFDREAVAAARALFPTIAVAETWVRALCETAQAFGVDSLRAPLQALRAARAHAALVGRAQIESDDVAVAARLVIGPRATMLPSADEEPPPAEPENAEQPENPDEQDDTNPDANADLILDAARAAIPPGLLDALRSAAPKRASATGAGLARPDANRGRPVGHRRGALRSGARLDLIATLRAAAPWQRLRHAKPGRVAIRPDDIRLRRFQRNSETVTIFAVDASGSAALHRLREAKGAVELVLAECYVRRDQVALISFRGRVAELILPPTRSLPRAKRLLAAMPAGGGTPLAAALDATAALADAIRRKGRIPQIVMLTDGRGNVARDGTGDRTRAMEDAMTAARLARAAGIAALLVDTAPYPADAARQLADAWGARYLALPRADAAHVAAAVKSFSQ